MPRQAQRRDDLGADLAIVARKHHERGFDRRQGCLPRNRAAPTLTMPAFPAAKAGRLMRV
jgi:hypothetical protein